MVEFNNRIDTGSIQRAQGPKKMEEAQRRNVDLHPDMQGLTSTEEVQEQQKKSKTSDAKEKASISRPMSDSDVADLLFNLRQPPTESNKQLLSLVLQHGLEASQGSLDSILDLLQGRSGRNHLESAVVSYSKGLEQSPKSVELLSKFLSGDPSSLLKTAENLKLLVANFQSSLSSGMDGIPPSLLEGLIAISGSLSDELDKLLKKYSEKSDYDLSDINRKELIENFKAFHDILGGIKASYSEEVQNFDFFSSLDQTKEAVVEFLNLWTTQAILSKDDRNIDVHNERFFFWQLPNTLAQSNEKNINMLIKKRFNGKETIIDEKNTRVVLQFETPQIGELSVIVDVKDKDLKYTFQATSLEAQSKLLDLSEDLEERMESLGYKVSDLKAIPKRLEVKKYLLPTINLDSITRVVTEV